MRLGRTGRLVVFIGSAGFLTTAASSMVAGRGAQATTSARGPEHTVRARPATNAAVTSRRASAAGPHIALVDEYCLSCHDKDHEKGGLVLENIADQDVAEHAEVWEKVVRKLRARLMPPVGKERPDDPTFDSVVSFLETSLDRAAAAQPNPGRTATIRRLTRTEYKNAVRDLLALDIDVTSMLPADESSYGFDN